MASSHSLPPHILIADDDDNLRRLVAAYLQREGYRVSEAADGKSAYQQAESERPDLLVLDVMLPGATGLQIARKLGGRVPVLMLTALGEEGDVLQGFDAGADDYLVKPFNPKELVARVRAILRRSGADTVDGGEAERLGGGELALDPRCREVKLRGRPLDLTAKEFDLLRALMEHPGWVFTRDELLESVWGYQIAGETRVVDTHIANLRKKIEDDPAEPRYIRTVRGAGYKFQEP